MNNQRANEYGRCVNILNQMLSKDQHLDDCFNSLDTPLIQQICYGAARHFFYYDAVADHLIDKPLPDKHQDIHLLIVCGLYSIDHLNRPAHASVNNVVNAVKGLRKEWARGLVNALLRRYGREKEEIQASVTNSSIEAQLNHPDWLIKLCNESWPNRSDILPNNNCRAPMTLRVNLKQTSREQYLERLGESGLNGRAGEYTNTAIVLHEPVSVDQLPGFNEGLVSVQDEAPQLAAQLLNLSSEQRVLDACAAPGTKTGHLLEMADIHVTAIDRDKKRTPRIHENLERLQLTAEVVTGDFLEYQTDNPFDRVLLDVPCSATGIIRRHPDIKLLRKKSDIAKLAHLQHELLNKAFSVLRTGGEVLYSTCSILPSENDDLVDEFLRNTPSAEVIALNHPSAGPDSTLVATRNGLQFLPTADSHDGFYYASIRKNA